MSPRRARPACALLRDHAELATGGATRRVPSQCDCVGASSTPWTAVFSSDDSDAEYVAVIWFVSR